MLCAIAREAVTVACRRGRDTACFRGYRVVARRLDGGVFAAAPRVELTLARTSWPHAPVRTAVASRDQVVAASVVESLPALAPEVTESFPVG